MSFSRGYTRPMDFKTLPLRANDCGHQLVAQRGPKSTAAVATRGSRPIALGTYLGAARISIVYRVMRRGVGALRQRRGFTVLVPDRPITLPRMLRDSMGSRGQGAEHSAMGRT